MNHLSSSSVELKRIPGKIIWQCQTTFHLPVSIASGKYLPSTGVIEMFLFFIIMFFVCVLYVFIFSFSIAVEITTL